MKRFLLIVFVFLFNSAFAQGQLQEQNDESDVVRRCHNCGAIAYSKLAMSCDECNASLEDVSKAAYDKKYSAFKIRLMYIGDKPQDLPKYAKLYVNGKYIDKIEQTEIQARNSELDQKWNDGLGGAYTALYEYCCSKITPGLKNIAVEMRFSRMGGLLKSNKKAFFEYVGFKAGEETKIDHYFNSPVSFTQHKKIEELNKTTNKSPIPELPEARVVTGNGTIGIDLGL